MWGNEEEIVITPAREKLFENFDKHRNAKISSKQNNNYSSDYLVLFIPEAFLYRDGRILIAREVKSWIKANQSKIMHLYWYIGTKVGVSVGIDPHHFSKAGRIASVIYDHVVNRGFRAFLVKQWVFDRPEKEDNVKNARLLEAWIQAIGVIYKNQNFRSPFPLLKYSTLNVKIEEPFYKLERTLQDEAYNIAGNFNKPLLCLDDKCSVAHHVLPDFNERNGVRCKGEGLIEYDNQGKVVRVKWNGVHLNEIVEIGVDGKIVKD
ncbi:uncharacterized protein LOC118434301 [Folsomia candida]|nr:uncharacterized protein LOC118434301 [Folsomia candida]